MLIQPARFALLSDLMVSYALSAVTQHERFALAAEEVVDASRSSGMFRDIFRTGINTVGFHRNRKVMTDVTHPLLSAMQHHIMANCGAVDRTACTISRYLRYYNSNHPYWGCLVHPAFGEMVQMMGGETIDHRDIYADVTPGNKVYPGLGGLTGVPGHAFHTGSCNAELRRCDGSAFETALTLSFDGIDHEGHSVIAGWTARVEVGDTAAVLVPTDGFRRIRGITGAGGLEETYEPVGAFVCPIPERVVGVGEWA